AADALRVVQQRVYHELRRGNDHAPPMTAVCADEIDGHGRADTDYAHRHSPEEMMSPDGRDIAIHPQAPGLDIPHGDAAPAPRDAHELRGHARTPRRGRHRPVHLRPRHARDQRALWTARPAE